ncbi:uncharacterized protein PGTG_10729 [Puccinia graminis f. sp. tritici CRL 75-36-700-3]|uniref:Superoxide dismutase copper/zinc binding domain-containing protein n=1 Tax=Puccinia graminis f. sp. tritici (strain CRL 75-36-700-3 / race SCCL) TaxID=418459 RepID=E3KJU5_PUCGT|nr:uncharacterized protein PGTG_10729 [Puccinia graminis f. sp. tritici CRL 75-36-700-3]EFP84570.1 hypothetical protein PGTG_10729 [Puccinia graminis f. sp. tritici CRL 75-36-700-3]
MVKPLSILPVFSVFLPQVLSHSFIIALDGANGVQSSGFGTRLTTRGQVHQYTGIITDKEIKAGTVGPCGKIFGGDNFPPFVIDPHAELARAEANGVSTVHKDGSIVMGVFVHNPDGSGPFKCDYSPDASLSKFEPMNITVQIEGVDGVNPAAENYVYPLTAAFFPNATCTGGKGKDTCIVRCRNQLGFGSCAALKLGEAAKRAKPSHPSNSTHANHTAEGEKEGHKTGANNTAAKNQSNSAPLPPPHEPKPVNQTNTPPVADPPAPINTTVAPPPPAASPPITAAVVQPEPPQPAVNQPGAPQSSQLTDGPNPDAFRIYNSGAPPPEPPAVAPASPGNNPNVMSSSPPPHDPNYNALTADIPSSPAGVERRSLPKTKRLFLHKRPRRHF